MVISGAKIGQQCQLLNVVHSVGADLGGRGAGGDSGYFFLSPAVYIFLKTVSHRSGSVQIELICWIQIRIIKSLFFLLLFSVSVRYQTYRYFFTFLKLGYPLLLFIC